MGERPRVVDLGDEVSGGVLGCGLPGETHGDAGMGVRSQAQPSGELEGGPRQGYLPAGCRRVDVLDAVPDHGNADAQRAGDRAQKRNAPGSWLDEANA